MLKEAIDPIITHGIENPSIFLKISLFPKKRLSSRKVGAYLIKLSSLKYDRFPKKC